VRELVALIVEGLDTRDIAERLFISRHTTQDHLKSVSDKVGVHSRLALISGVCTGLIDTRGAPPETL